MRVVDGAAAAAAAAAVTQQSLELAVKVADDEQQSDRRDKDGDALDGYKCGQVRQTVHRRLCARTHTRNPENSVVPYEISLNFTTNFVRVFDV